MSVIPNPVPYRREGACEESCFLAECKDFSPIRVRNDKEVCHPESKRGILFFIGRISRPLFQTRFYRLRPCSRHPMGFETMYHSRHDHGMAEINRGTGLSLSSPMQNDKITVIPNEYSHYPSDNKYEESCFS